MSVPTYDYWIARNKGKFSRASSFEEVEPGLFLVRGAQDFYVRATDEEMAETGLRRIRVSEYA